MRWRAGSVDTAGCASVLVHCGLRFEDLECYHRGPFTWRGETTERFYLLATKPG